MKPENPTSRAWTIAAIPVALAGLTTLLVNDLVPPYWKARIGYTLFGIAVLIALAAHWTTRRALTARQRKIKRGRTIVGFLIGEGDKLYHQPHIVMDDGGSNYRASVDLHSPSPVERWCKAVEDWRAIVGERLAHAPFKRDTGDWVLTQGGNRLTEPLERLRQIQADVEKWIEED